MIEVDKYKMGYELYREARAEERGLIQVYAYHCYRCNYTWLPRDFDFCWNYWKTGWWGDDLFYREPPKSCARCKSRSWKQHNAQRKLRIALEEGNLPEPILKEMNNPVSRLHKEHHPWMWSSVARLRALERQGKLTLNDIAQVWKEFSPPDDENISESKDF
jgi:hypothetical protein